MSGITSQGAAVISVTPAQRGACVAESSYQILRVFSNNAVLARKDNDEVVLVGRGVGYARKSGQLLKPDAQLQRYVAVEADHAKHLDLLRSVEPALLDTIGKAIDLVSDIDGDTFDPSIYLLLTDHLAFAIQRLREGHAIHNPLLSEIKSVFAQDYASAKLILKYINFKLDLALPEDEVAFITLHINAARRGSSVKSPMRRANRVAGIIGFIRKSLSIPDGSAADYDRLASEIVYLEDRITVGQLRHNPAQLSIHRDLPREIAIAKEVVAQLLKEDMPPRALSGEVSYLAMFLHGWAQDVEMNKSKGS